MCGCWPCQGNWSVQPDRQPAARCAHLCAHQAGCQPGTRYTWCLCIHSLVSKVELHPLLQQNALLTFCKKHNIVVRRIVLCVHCEHVSHVCCRFRRTRRSAHLTSRSQKSRPCCSCPSWWPSPPSTRSRVRYCSWCAHCIDVWAAAQIALKWAVQRGTVALPKSVNPARVRVIHRMLSTHLTAHRSLRMPLSSTLSWTPMT